MSLIRLIALAFAPALASAPAAVARLAPAPETVAAQEDHQKIYDDFVQRVPQVLKLHAADDMAALVRRQPVVAVRYADTLCQQVAVAGNDQIEKEIAGLRVAWKTAMKTDFVANQYEYYSLLDSRIRPERLRMALEYDKAMARYDKTITGDRSEVGFMAAVDEFENLARGFKACGDLLNVGRCHVVIMNCWDETQRGKDANLYKACAAAKAALAAYEEIGLAGPDVSALRLRYESLVANGYDTAEPDPNAPKAGQPVAAADAASIQVAMTFEALPEVEVYQRPHFYADDIYQVWSAAPLAGKDSTATISALAQRSPTLVRTASAQFGVDDAGDTERELFAVTGKMTLIEVTLQDEHGTRPWAFITKVGLQDDFYQGVRANMGPSDGFMSLFYFNAASVVGTLDEVQVRVIDDNLDGVYGSLPLEWQYMGLATNATKPDFDGIVIGESTRALPWSEFVPVNGRWYRLEPQQGGMTLRATPVELATGHLRLEFKGEYPEWLVLRGTGVLENTFIDVCLNGKKGVDAPVGEYRLVSGMVRKGKKQQAMKCLVLGNDSVPPVVVTAGAQTVVELGAPFRFDFERAEAEGKVTVSGPSVRVIGRAGETYDRFWNCAPNPGVSMRKAGTKKGGKPEDMPTVTGSLDELREDGTRRWAYADVWRPLTLVLEPKKPGEPVELQMLEKKHKLLGEIESDWK
ncbi:MAG TPA: hypothetical protein VMT18_08815 [Planctomycetota bacterium]|nr:hypothetical protein [Planctomycetota bacterium]